MTDEAALDRGDLERIGKDVNRVEADFLGSADAFGGVGGRTEPAELMRPSFMSEIASRAVSLIS